MALAAFLARPIQDLNAASARPPIVIPTGMRRMDSRPLPVSFGLSDRFHVRTVVSLKTLTSQRANVLRVTRPGEAECVPCVDYEQTGEASGAFILQFGQATLSVAARDLLMTDYFYLDCSLTDRTLALNVYRGTTPAFLFGQQTAFYPFDFPEHTERAIYFARGSTRARGSYDPQVEISQTLLGGARAYFRVGYSTILTNSINTNGSSLQRTTLLPAYGIGAYAQMYPSTPTTSSDGPGGALRSVCFDGESALAHSITDNRYVLDGEYNTALTSCAWVKRTDAIDTLFSTFLDGAHQLRLYLWFDEISGLAHGHNAIDTRSGTNLAIGEWNHVCFGAALGQPAKLWVNGTLVSSETQTAVTGAASATRPLGIGGSMNTQLHTTFGIDRGVKACMSEAVVFGRLLSNSDALRIYRAGIRGDSLLDL